MERVFILLTIVVITASFFNYTYDAQAAVSFVACGTAVGVGSGNMTSVGIPSGIANDDILITYVHSRDNVDSTMPGDWTSKLEGNGNSTNRLEIFWKRTTGSESTLTVTHSGGNAAIARMCAFREVETSGDPFDIAGSAQSNAGSPVSTAAITTTVANAMILHLFGSQDDNTWGSYTGTPTIEASQDQNNQSGNNDSSAVLTYGLLASIGSTGTAGAAQATAGPDAGVSVQVALRPADVIAPAAVTTLAVSGPTSSSILVSWTAPGDDGATGTSTAYDLRYSTSTITGGNFSSATQVGGEPTPSVGGSSESMTVSGLSASTTYFFAIKTSDEVSNVSALSNVASGTTLSNGGGGGAPSPTLEARSGGVEPTSVIFAGQAYPGSRIEILKRDTWSGVYDNTPLISYKMDSGGVFEMILTRLLQGNYFFTLWAVDADGQQSGMASFNADLISQGKFEVRDIFMSPTLVLAEEKILEGEFLTITGYAAPVSKIRAEVDGELIGAEAVADEGGYYKASINTLGLIIGKHEVRLRQVDKGGISSDFSLQKSFTVYQAKIPDLLPQKFSDIIPAVLPSKPILVDRVVGGMVKQAQKELKIRIRIESKPLLWINTNIK